MKNLPIRLKVPIFLGLTLAVVIGSFLVINNLYQSHTVAQLYGEASDELRWAMSNDVETLMMNGANDQIQPLFEEVASRDMAKHAVIVDAEKTIARSTDKSEIGKRSGDPLWDILFKSQRDTLVTATVDGEPLVIGYRVFANTGVCADCHEGTILGGMMMAKSEKAVKDRLASNSNVMILLGLLGGLVMVAGFVIILNRNVFTPLASIQAKLHQAAQGDVTQDIKVKSEDEIGRLLNSIRDLIAYMRDLAQAAEKIAGGNLKVELNPKGEKDLLGKAFLRMVGNLESIVKELSDNAQKLAAASSQIAASSEQMSHGADSQAQQISQMSAAIEEMAATIVESSRNAGDASATAQNANGTAENGGAVVADTIRGMHKITEVVRSSSTSIGELAQAAEKIGAVVEVIDDIASQTNLLALNAAIEAARAGEQGRGFAVVADEVRKLAERSGKATGEITDMVKSIQSKTGEAVASMKSGIDEVDRGRELADIAGNSLKEIVDQSQRVMAMIKQLAGASEEQSSTAEQISRNVEQISAITKETAAGAKQSASAAETLSHQAEELKQIVGRFQVRA